MNTSGSNNYNMIEAIEELRDWDGHDIMSGEHANLIGYPFGVTFKERTYKPNRNKPMGPQPSWDTEKQIWDWSPFKGVDASSVASVIASRVITRAKLDEVSAGSKYFGAGKSFDADVRQAKRIVQEHLLTD